MPLLGWAKLRTAATLAHPRRLLRAMRDGDQGRCTGARLGEWAGARDAYWSEEEGSARYFLRVTWRIAHAALVVDPRRAAFPLHHRGARSAARRTRPSIYFLASTHVRPGASRSSSQREKHSTCS